MMTCTVQASLIGSKAWPACLLGLGPDAIKSKIGLFKTRQTGKSDKQTGTKHSSDYQLTKTSIKFADCANTYPAAERQNAAQTVFEMKTALSVCICVEPQ